MSDNFVAALRAVAASAADEIEHLRSEVERLREGSLSEKVLDDLERLRLDNDRQAGEDEIEYLRRGIERLRAALDRLARLGNEPHYGNSVGNEIAREALKEDK
jgi:ubiquinone biosynthesis protein UbiJ